MYVAWAKKELPTLLANGNLLKLFLGVEFRQLEWNDDSVQRLYLNEKWDTLTEICEWIELKLSEGKNVLVHCAQVSE